MFFAEFLAHLIIPPIPVFVKDFFLGLGHENGFFVGGLFVVGEVSQVPDCRKAMRMASAADSQRSATKPFGVEL